MIFQAILLGLVVSTLSQTTVHKHGYCSMYGVMDPPYQKNNHVYNKPAKGVTKEMYGILKDVCPHLAEKPLNETLTCCGPTQLVNLKEQLKTAAALFSRCPSCIKNFYNLWCDFTCSPDQSLFVDYTYKEKWPFMAPKSKYYLTNQFAEGLYSSCKDVIFPGSNGLVLDFMCGTTAALCNSTKFLTFMGTPPNAPFAISFKVDESESGFVSHDKKAIKCNETYFDQTTRRNTSACSCQDCEASCPIPPTPPAPPKPTYILGIKSFYFITCAILLVWIFVFLMYNVLFVMCSSKKKQQEIASRANHLRTDSTVSNGEMHKSTDMIYNKDAKAGKSFFVLFGIRVEQFLQNIFKAWGTWCAHNPWKVIIGSMVIVIVCSLGLIMVKITTNPVDLWSSKQSEARTDKDYFDTKFSPFYRTEQLIITTSEHRKPILHDVYQSSNDRNFSGIMYGDFLNATLKLQLELMAVTGKTESGEIVTLEDICLQPMSPDNTECTVFSALQYWQNNQTKFDKCITNMPNEHCSAHQVGTTAEDWHDQIIGCTSNPSSQKNGNYLKLPCMSAFGAPVPPKLVFGGFTGDNYEESTALIITFVVRNSLVEAENARAEAWEKVFLEHVENWQKNVAPSLHMKIAFSSERSIQDEISRASESDVLTIFISYLLMFLYIAIGLGQFKSLQRILVDAKVTVGICGVLIVLLSVSASLGVFSYAGVPLTLIIVEVIPFLVLAVGVDNIFILVQALQRDKKPSGETIPEQVGRVLGMVGPSMLLSSLSESVAFGFGGLSTMPAVYTFSIFASLAVAFNFLLQVTALVAVVSLDAKRQSRNKYDVACCAGIDKSDNHEECVPGGVLYYVTRKIYAPFVMLFPVRIIVVLVFSIYLAISVCFIPNIDIGLDQTQAFPKDSYLINYFGNISAYLKTGAPVYFVVKEGYNYSDPVEQNNVCGVAGCDANSVVGQIFTNSLISNYSTIALPASSWIDDYFAWIDPVGSCCRVVNYTMANGTKDFSKAGQFCPSSSPVNWTCHSCLPKSQSGMRPSTAVFTKYLPWYLSDNPTTECAKGGHPAYGSAVKLNPQGSALPVNASYFMTYHTVASTSQEFIACMKRAKEIASTISEHVKHEVFPYSVFYVFYEQYLSIVENTWKDLLIVLAAIFVVTFVMMGFNIGLAFCICLTVAMIIVDLLGLMYMWDISLNAVSLVNLIMSAGIAVEFCSHIARAFSTSPYSSRVKRAEDALARVGSSVFSGITLTKFVGVFVLMFAKSQLFEIYYFRMYMGVIIMGALHGLIFLPVLLSYIGPDSRATDEDIQRASMLQLRVKPQDKDSFIAPV